MFSFESTSGHVLDWLMRLFHAIAGAAQDRLDDMSAPIFIGAVLLILALERIIPAKPNQPIFSISFFQDIIWAFIEGIGQATVLVAWVVVLREFYNQHLGFLTVKVDVQLPSWLTILLILVWHARFYHGNIKTDLGLLRYAFVTPQSHRIHHPLEERHMDKNFGAFFSIWDWIFGTQYRGHTEYPYTGVLDQTFPIEKSAGPFSLILTPLLQVIYPFRVIGRSLVSRFSQRQARG